MQSGFLFAFLSMLGFGAYPPFAKRLAHRVGALWSVALVHVALGTLLLLTAPFLFRPFSPDAATVALLIVMVVGGAANILWNYHLLRNGHATVITALFNTSAVFVTLGAPLVGDRVSSFFWFPLLLIVGGAILVSRDRNRWSTGALQAVGVAAGFAAYTLLSRVAVARIGAVDATIILETGIATLLLSAALIMKRNIRLGSDWIVPGLLFSVGAAAFYFALVAVGAPLTAAIGAGAPLVTALIAWAFGEQLRTWQYVGTAFVVLGLILLALT